MQGAFFCCFRQGMAGMSQDFAKGVAGTVSLPIFFHFFRFLPFFSVSFRFFLFHFFPFFAVFFFFFSGSDFLRFFFSVFFRIFFRFLPFHFLRKKEKRGDTVRETPFAKPRMSCDLGRDVQGSDKLDDNMGLIFRSLVEAPNLIWVPYLGDLFGFLGSASSDILSVALTLGL